MIRSAKSHFLNLLILNVLTLVGLNFSCARVSEAMDFRYAGTGGNCAGCYWIVASGEITQDTPKEFKKFISGDPQSFLVVLDSHGGHLFGGIELGRLIREFGLHTTIAKSRRPAECFMEGDCPSYLENFEAGTCLSACAYAYLGGAHRIVANTKTFAGHSGSVIGFHQFYGDLDKQSRITEIIEEETYFSKEQLVSAFVLQFLTDMGVDPNVLGVAALAGPDQMEYPDATLRQSLKIDYQPDFSFGELDLEVYKGGLLGFSQPNYDNKFNNLRQITFYRRDEDTLNVLLTFLRIPDPVISRTFGKVSINLNKGPEWYDHNNNTFEFGYTRVKQWSDAKNSYISFTLNTLERRQFLKARELAVNIDVARVYGAFKAYLNFNEKSHSSLQLISKTCF